jgi:prepilin signal peptidase PulO-like enzyme (type II secretory pathway)
MDTLILCSLFGFGAIVGSFLNVVALRYNTGMGLNGRSACFTCRKALSPLELVPVLSWFFQKGRCHGCKAPVSFQYPLVELSTAVLFSLSYAVGYSGAALAYLFLAFSILTVIVVYDFRHTIIPDAFSYSFIALAGLGLFLGHDLSSISSLPTLLDLLAGPLLFLPFWFLWAVSKGTWMGFGDAKLAWGIGWFLGFWHGLSSIILGFWIGAAVGLTLLILKKLLGRKMKGRYTMKTELPFAPFLILALLITFFTGLSVF